MRGEEFLDKFGLIDQKYIEEAQEKTRRKNIRTPILIAACFLLILTVAALPFFRNDKTPNVIQAENLVDTSELPDITYTLSPVYDGIPYSELDICDTDLDPSLSELMGGSAMLIDFCEDDLSLNTAVIEGKVVNVRTKFYNILTDYDKFGDGYGTRFFENSVIYDIEVEKIYNGKVTVGEVFTVETTVTVPRQTFFLKEGHSYVISIMEVGEDWGYWHGNVIEGSTERDSMYSVIYQCHHQPPIERTEDGYYLFCDRWTTLAESENAYRVTMDIPFDNDKSYFNDKMMIIDSVNFEKLFMQILEKNQ